MKKLALVILVACSPTAEKRTETAVEVSAYSVAIHACVEKAKALPKSDRLDAFEACAREADKKYGYDAGAP